MTTTIHRISVAVMAGGFALATAACAGGARLSGPASVGGGNGLPATPDPYLANTYQNPGINAFVESTTNPASAFSADVDTGSYTVGRKYLNDGHRPNPDSVRVEEYVNYFDQGYARPTTATFGLSVDGAPTPFVQDAANNRIVRLGVQAKEVAQDVRKDASLTFVIDTSGSMADGDRLGLVKKSLTMLVDQLGTGDTVTIVTFSDSARIVLPSTPASDRRAIVDGIGSLQVNGGTNLGTGLKVGYEQAQKAFKVGGVNRVILASDGVANEGMTGPDGLAQQVRAASGKGIQLVTIGVGMGNYNDVMMEQLADKGDGFYAYVDSVEEAQRLFRERLMSTIEPVALDTNIGVVWDKAKVVRYRLMGFENRSLPGAQVNAPAVLGGQVNSGHSVTALYEISLAPGVATDPTASLGIFGVRWVDPTTKAVDGLVHPMLMSDLFPSWDAAPPRLRLDATVAQYADVLRNNPYASRFSLGDISKIAVGLPREIPDDAKVAEFADLTRKATGVV